MGMLGFEMAKARPENPLRPAQDFAGTMIRRRRAVPQITTTRCSRWGKRRKHCHCRPRMW